MHHLSTENSRERFRPMAPLQSKMWISTEFAALQVLFDVRDVDGTHAKATITPKGERLNKIVAIVGGLPDNQLVEVDGDQCLEILEILNLGLG